MAIIYDESVRTGINNTSISQANSTNAYLRHYANKLYLSFIASNGTRDERWQAERELVICERKLRFWERHPNFVAELARIGMEKLNKEWNQKGRP